MAVINLTAVCYVAAVSDLGASLRLRRLPYGCGVAIEQWPVMKYKTAAWIAKCSVSISVS
jgi:hypothetical protein